MHVTTGATELLYLAMPCLPEPGLAAAADGKAARDDAVDRDGSPAEEADLA